MTNKNEGPPELQEVPDAASKTLPVIGLIITLIWVIAIAVYIVLNVPAFTTLPPNEMGDFAAGAFAPLAFLWLVLGFFQQGKELRNSGQALWLQGRELQHSVEQQRQLVEVTREQLLFENQVLTAQREEIARNAQPMLALEQSGSNPGGQDTRLFQFQLVNRGKPCTDLVISTDKNAVSGTTRDLLGTGARWQLLIELPVGSVEPFELGVHYLDERLVRGTTQFLVSGLNSSFEISLINTESIAA